MDQKSIFELIRMERIRQDRLHPEWKGDNHGLVVLAEEFGEVAKALYELKQLDGSNSADDYCWKADDLRTEIIQVAAVCVRWLENGLDT